MDTLIIDTLHTAGYGLLCDAYSELFEETTPQMEETEERILKIMNGEHKLDDSNGADIELTRYGVANQDLGFRNGFRIGFRLALELMAKEGGITNDIL